MKTSAWIELSIWRCKRCHEHSMVKFVSTHDYLIPPRCVSISEQAWALEGCTSANFSHCILRTETKTSSAKDWRIYYMITKYFPAPWNYQMNLLVSLWFCFVFIWDESVTSCVNQKYRKSFYSYDKNKLFSYDKVSRSSLVPNLSTWQFYFPCRLFFLSLFVCFFF